MKIPSLISTLVAAVWFSTTVCAQTSWPDFMPSQEPGLSTSPVLATLPQDLTVEAPPADVPPDKARWSGRWRGWACRDQICDTRLLVEKVNADGAVIFYAFASATQKPSIARVEAKFVGDELQGTLVSGAKLAYRMRKSGDLEFLWQRNASWAAGVLSREK